MNKKTIKAKNKNHLKKLIDKQIQLNGNCCNLNFIDTSKITDMTNLFYESDFNGDISKWDTSNVANMPNMFNSSSFNGDISNWNTSNVTNMSNMFHHSKFNGDISKWNTSNVIYMPNMFSYSKFNGDISKWNVSNVKSMPFMFAHSKFDGDITGWDIKNVKSIRDIFQESQSTNIPYWAKIEDYDERISAYQIAYQVYHSKKEKELLLNILNKNNDLILKTSKDIIKI